jgi:hypothetical protein
VLTWSLPPTESSREIYVARSSLTTPAGAFYEENIVTRADGELASNARQWAPKDPLYAGRYWWNVESRDEDFQSYFSPPSGFVIRPSIAITSARIEYLYGLGWAEITIRYRSNVKTLAATAKLSTLRGRGIWSGRSRESYITPGRVEEATITWRRLRGVAARRIRLVVTLRGSGVAKHLNRIVRAPGFGDV